MILNYNLFTSNLQTNIDATLSIHVYTFTHFFPHNSICCEPLERKVLYHFILNKYLTRALSSLVSCPMAVLVRLWTWLPVMRRLDIVAFSHGSYDAEVRVRWAETTSCFCRAKEFTGDAMMLLHQAFSTILDEGCQTNRWRGTDLPLPSPNFCQMLICLLGSVRHIQFMLRITEDLLKWQGCFKGHCTTRGQCTIETITLKSDLCICQWLLKCTFW